MSKQETNSDTKYRALLDSNPQKAIEILFREYYKPLVHIVFKYTRDQALAEDIVQDVFHDFWKKHDQLNITASIFGYLRRTAINKTLNYFRDQHIKTTDWEDHHTEKSVGAKPQRSLEGRELEELLAETIKGLPERCRLVFIMSREEEKSYKEIAQTLDISVKTVENQISKALKIIRKTLTERWPGVNFAFWLTFLINF